MNSASMLEERKGHHPLVASACSNRVRRSLLALAVLLSLAAALVRPHDAALSNIFRAKAEGREASTLWYLAQPVKLFGKGDVLFVLALLLAIQGKKKTAVKAVLAMALAGLVLTPLKFAAERERPDSRDARSFPSGDLAALAAFVVPIAAAWPASTPLFSAGVATVGAARVLVGRHFPSDVLAGAAIGILAACIILSLRFTLRAWFWSRTLRRSYLAGFLACLVLLRVLIQNEHDLQQFLTIFGPAMVLLVVFRLGRPFLRLRIVLQPATPVATALQNGAPAARRPEKNLAATVRERTLRRQSGCLRAWLGIPSPVLRALALPAHGMVAGIGILFFALLLAVSTQSTLWDRDEPRFAQATLEMLRSGNFLVPTFQNELRADKPILIYWLMALPASIFGATEFSFRLPAALGAALVCLLTFFLGRQLISQWCGIWAMIILATTPLLLVPAGAATTDAVLLATLVGAFLIFESMLRKDAGLREVLLFALVIGLAMLTKGPVGLAIPLLGILSALAFSSRVSRTTLMALVGAFLGGIGLFLVWAIPANLATQGEFQRQEIGYHVIKRMLRPDNHHGGDHFLFFFFYLTVVLLAFFPWTLFLPAAISATAGGRVGGVRGRAVLLGWTLTTLLLMSLVSTKLPHYILPICPALALMVAGMLAAAESAQLTSKDLAWLRRSRWIFGTIGFAVGLALVITPWLLPAATRSSKDFGLAGASTAVGCVVLLITALGLREQQAARYRSTIATLAGGVLALALTVVFSGLPAAERFKVSKPLADAICARIPKGVPVAERDYGEPSLVFYLRGRRVESLGDDDAVKQWARVARPGVLVISRDALARIEKQRGSLGLQPIGGAQGFNYSKGRWVDLLALGRSLPETASRR